MARKTHVRNRIKELRAGTGITQAELAAAVGVTRQTVNAIEREKYSPSLEVAFLIAHELAVDVGEAFWFED